MTRYFLTAAAWAIGGFVAGYALAVAQNRGFLVRGQRNGHRSGWLTRAAGPLVVLLAVLMGAQYWYEVHVIEERNVCQAEYNQAISKTLTIRSKLTARAIANQNLLIGEVGKLVATEEEEGSPEEAAEDAQLRKLFAGFAAEAQEIEEERAANPLPQIPECVN